MIESEEDSNMKSLDYKISKIEINTGKLVEVLTELKDHIETTPKVINIVIEEESKSDPSPFLSPFEAILTNSSIIFSLTYLICLFYFK